MAMDDPYLLVAYLLIPAGALTGLGGPRCARATLFITVAISAYLLLVSALPAWLGVNVINVISLAAGVILGLLAQMALWLLPAALGGVACTVIWMHIAAYVYPDLEVGARIGIALGVIVLGGALGALFGDHLAPFTSGIIGSFLAVAGIAYIAEGLFDVRTWIRDATEFRCESAGCHNFLIVWACLCVLFIVAQLGVPWLWARLRRGKPARGHYVPIQTEEGVRREWTTP